jgi:glycine/D-amino acid oxidase-like deaminating enzyme
VKLSGTTASRIASLRREAGDFGFEYEMLSRDELSRLLPGVGPTVVGGWYTRYDGDANPLALMCALNGAMQGCGVTYVPNARATITRAAPRSVTVSAGGEVYSAPKLVLAAGVGTQAPELRIRRFLESLYRPA